MIALRFLTIVVLLSLIGLPFLVPARAYYAGFTHAVYIESVTATWCSVCRLDQEPISKAHEKYLGSIYSVSFHVADEWETEYGMKKANEYRTTATPTYAYDAGHNGVNPGFFSRDKIESAGRRSVHRISLAVVKVVEAGIVSFEGSIKEEDNRVFNGTIVVIAIENGLRSASVIWNSVFRAYLLKLDVSIPSGGYIPFSGNWRIPDNVNIGNLELIAAAFDSDDRVGPWGPFSVQAVSDVDSGAVIPEFNTALNVAGAATIVTITALRRKRRLARDVKNRVANLLECFPSSQVGF